MIEVCREITLTEDQIIKYLENRLDMQVSDNGNSTYLVDGTVMTLDEMMGTVTDAIMDDPAIND